jgi:hypothetical protein
LELYKALENKLDPNSPIQHIVVSIAPQVFANLAAKFNVPSQKVIILVLLVSVCNLTYVF